MIALSPGGCAAGEMPCVDPVVFDGGSCCCVSRRGVSCAGKGGGRGESRATTGAIRTLGRFSIGRCCVVKRWSCPHDASTMGSSVESNEAECTGEMK